MTDELDTRIRTLHTERARPMARWNLLNPQDRNPINERRLVAELIARTPWHTR